MSRHTQILAGALAVAKFANAQAFVNNIFTIPVPIVGDVGDSWPLGFGTELAAATIITANEHMTIYEAGIADSQTVTMVAGPSTYGVHVDYVSTSSLEIDCSHTADDLVCSATAEIENAGSIFSSASAATTVDYDDVEFLTVTATVVEGLGMLTDAAGAVDPTNTPGVDSTTVIMDTFTDTVAGPTTLTRTEEGGQTVIMTVTNGGQAGATGAADGNGNGNGNGNSGSGSNSGSTAASNSENGASERVVGIAGVVIAAAVGIIAVAL